MLALLALLVAACGGGGANNAPAVNSPANKPDEPGLEFERVALEKLTVRDPAYLWPRDGARLSADSIWVIWKTDDLSAGRLLGTKNGMLWYDLGATMAKVHYLPLDLAKFGSDAGFSVEFEEGGERFRSRQRNVRFGQGIRFTTRRIECAVERADKQTFTLKTETGDLQGLSADDFTFALFPDDMTIYGVPHRESDTSGYIELVIDGRSVPGKGCTGFMEMRDSRTDTRDRVLIVISVK